VYSSILQKKWERNSSWILASLMICVFQEVSYVQVLYSTNWFSLGDRLFVAMNSILAAPMACKIPRNLDNNNIIIMTSYGSNTLVLITVYL
jgi:hypothetical protein